MDISDYQKEEMARICGIEPDRHEVLKKKASSLFNTGEECFRPLDTIGKIIVDEELEPNEKVFIASMFGTNLNIMSIPVEEDGDIMKKMSFNSKEELSAFMSGVSLGIKIASKKE